MSYFLDSDARETREFVPGIVLRTVWGANMLVAHVTLLPDAILPRHSHPHEQGGVIVHGELTLTVDDETKVLHPGDVYLIPGGVPHHGQAGPDGCLAVDIFSPVREDYCY